MLWIYSAFALARQALKGEEPFSTEERIHKQVDEEEKNVDQKYEFTVDDSVFNTLSTDLLKRKHGFVAELVTNAYDANKKLTDLLKDETADIGRDIVIEITTENDKCKFKIMDTGIGMTKEEIIKYIGTIGGSGTKECKSKDLIGRFGMGFYSVFREADKVEIHTRKHGTEKGHVVSLHSNSRAYHVREEDKAEPGTDITVWLNDSIKLNNADVQRWVLENLLSNANATHYNIRVKKTEEEKVNERNDEIKSRKDAIQKKKDDRKAAKEKAEKEAKEKAEKKAKAEKERADKIAKGEEVEELKEEPVEEQKEELVEEEIDENLYEDNIVIQDYRILTLCPWSDKDNEEQLKAIYKERYNKSNLKYTKKVTFNVKQKIDKGKEWNTRFEAMLFIPEPQNDMMRQDKAEGKIEVFVSGSKINDPNLDNIGEFLKNFYIIVRSNEAILASTREEFLDSKNTVKNLINALTRKVVDIFIEKRDDEIHDYSKTIKSGFIENKRNGNESVLDRLAGIITFDTDSGTYCLNKF
ncbi:hypothetical protein COBT_003497, partial [Conglomerata obtusa]